MKTLLLLSLLLASAATYAQAVLRVNNSAGSAVLYSTLADAITAAGPTDIIMVEGSLTNYGALTINKKVTIVGPGYFLTENQNLQATVQPASVGAITLNTGATGSSLAGLTFANGTGVTINGANNISILNSRFSGSCRGIRLDGTGTNIQIKGNYKEGGCGAFIEAFGSYTGVLVSNNYSDSTILTGATSTFTISNNVIDNNYYNELQNSVVQNNIFTFAGSNVTISIRTGSVITNNVFVRAEAGLNATNLISQSLSSLFVGLAGSTTDTQWKLKAGSPALTAGVGGTECGMYGGPSPYRPSGIAASQPTITDYNFPSTIPKNGVLNVKVSAKVN